MRIEKSHQNIMAMVREIRDCNMFHITFFLQCCRRLDFYYIYGMQLQVDYGKEMAHTEATFGEIISNPYLAVGSQLLFILITIFIVSKVYKMVLKSK